MKSNEESLCSNDSTWYGAKKISSDDHGPDDAVSVVLQQDGPMTYLS